MSNQAGDTSQKDFNRLTTLYSISKKLSVFSKIEESFVEIVACAAECFPLSSAVLIEHWENEPHTAIWYPEEISHEVVTKAIRNAKEAYAYFSGASVNQATDLFNSETPENIFLRSDKALLFKQNENGYFINIPLIIDNLPSLGSLQLEGTTPLDEHDLDFVIALANLVSVALDRYYKTKREHENQEEEARKSLKILYHSQDHIQHLETERELREVFVSLLTHDLRTPLTVVLGSAQMILRKPNDSQAIQKSAQTIVTHVNRAGQMITDLLDANRIRSGEGVKVNKESVDITSLIKVTLQELSLIHGDRFILNDAPSIQCSVDVKGVRRVIENLSNNAIKYGSSDTPVWVTLEQSPLDVHISVLNKGSYISPEDQKSLFLQFRRSETAEKGKIKGWGIGLALVRGVVEAHGGKISVKSDPESGTVFTVSFPKSFSCAMQA